MQAGIVAAEIAQAGNDLAAEFAGRRLADQVDCAAFGVAAEQGALRTLEDFDPLDFEQTCVQAVLAGEVDAVDVDADAGFACRLVGVARDDATDTDGQCGLARFIGGNAQRRDRAVAQVEQALHVTLLDVFIAHHGNGDRGLLQVRLTLGGGHDDVDKTGIVLRFGSGIGRGIGSRFDCGQRGRSNKHCGQRSSGNGKPGGKAVHLKSPSLGCCQASVPGESL